MDSRRLYTLAAERSAQAYVLLQCYVPMRESLKSARGKLALSFRNWLIMAHPPPRAPATTSALIVVRDLALGASLVSMLEACEVAPAIHDPDLGFSRLPLGIDTHFIVDFELLPPGAVAFLSDLRRGGWQGAAILMTEQPLDAVWSLPARCWKIEKPFVAGDLLAIFRQIAP